MAGAAWVAALLAAGCTKEGRPATSWEADPDAVRIEASVGTVTKTNPLGTGDEQTKFNKGDKISVIHVSANKYVNYVFDGTSWAPVGEDYLTWQTGGTNTFRLQYPHIGHESDFGEFFKDQSTVEKMTRSDLMEAEKVEYTKIPGNKILSAALKRKRSLVTVVIAGFGDELSSEDAKVTDLKLHLWDGGQGDEIITVTPFIRDAQGVAQPAGTAGLVGYSYTAIGRNDCKYSGKSFITMTVAGKSLTVANPADMVVGKHYTYKLIVGKKTVKIGGVTVENWTAGKLDGKFEAEVDDYSEWDGKKVTSGYTFSGSGISENPYLIKSAADLAGLAANVNSGTNYQGKYFRLETNIDLMGHEWTPIGTREKYFYGNFDGDGKVITNLTISNATDCAGLFGIADGTIQNIVLRNASVISSSTAALLVGESEGGVIKSCKVDGTVRSGYDAAGIVGASMEVKISDCEVNVECYGGNNVGGVLGSKTNYSWAVVVENCIVRGRICGKIVGGIAGMLQGSDVISGCKSYATLSQFDKKNYTTAGGIAGGAYYKCKFEDCEVYGNIDIECENDSEYFPLSVGGAIGRAGEVTISNLKFEGTMNVKSIKEEKGVGAVIGVVENSLTVSSECTYKKSGTGTFPPVGTYPEGVDISKITGI